MFLAPLISVFSLVPATFTLLVTVATAILFPLVAAVVLGILELTTNIVTSSETVLLLLFSPPILLFPVKLARSIGRPVVHVSQVVLAPALFPFQAFVVCAATVVSFLFEFKALYTFLATAATVGLAAGILLHLTTSLLSSVLGLGPDPTPSPAKQEQQPSRPVLHTSLSQPVVRPPKKASLGKRHPPALRKHVPDGPDGDARPRQVKFRFGSGRQNGALESSGIH